MRYNNNMSFDSKGKQAETEADIFEDIPISFEETKPVPHKKEQTTEEAVNPEAITEPRKKSLEDHFSFPKGLGELLGGICSNHDWICYWREFAYKCIGITRITQHSEGHYNATWCICHLYV